MRHECKRPGRQPESQMRFRLPLWTSLLVIAAVALLAQGVRVNEINVSGTVMVSPEEVAQQSGIQEGAPWWKVLTLPVQKNVEMIPRVEKAEVNLHLLRHLEILVREREAAALILKNGSYSAVDRNGLVMGSPGPHERNLIIVTGIENVPAPGEYLNGEQREAFAAFFRVWPDYSGLTLSELNLSDEQNLKIFLLNGLEVLVGDYIGLPEKFALLSSSILHMDLSRVSRPIDLRIGGMLIYNLDKEN